LGFTADRRSFSILRLAGLVTITKAAIAHFAPDIAKHVDPTSHQLNEIRQQLQQLDAKLTELKQQQLAGDDKTNCNIKVTHLSTIVSERRPR
jgi:hypothetical protein